jgi:hypothetical protein
MDARNCVADIQASTNRPSPEPDPNGWFHVRMVVVSPKVNVFVEDASEPSLIVSH